MEIDLPKWKKLVEMQYDAHLLQIFEKNNALLMVVPEQRSDRTIGFACTACKPFIAKGDVSSLSATRFPSELTVVKKFNAGVEQSFVLAFTKPSYARNLKASLAAVARLHEKALIDVQENVKSACKNIELTDAVNANGENAVLADSSLLFSFLSHLRSAAKQQQSQSIIGLDLKGDAVTCSVPSLSLGLVVGGQTRDRLHVLHLLMEEALLQNTNVIVFDTCDKFVGLSQPSSIDINDFISFSLPGLAVGFPVQEISPGQNTFIPLSSFNTGALLTPFNLHENEITPFLEKAISEKTVPDAPQYTQLRVQRMAQTVKQAFQGIFTETVHELPFNNGIGKVFHVNLSKCSKEARLFFAIGLVKELQKVEKPTFLVFEQEACELKTMLELTVDAFAGSNVSILCHCEHENEVPLLKSADFFAEVVIGSEVAITQGGKPPQRVKLRPTYSACSEN
ncbi:MAG: hypothetical protein V1722_03965 [Candidatus Micrarchaeota archaeon]